MPVCVFSNLEPLFYVVGKNIYFCSVLVLLFAGVDVTGMSKK